MPEPMNDSRIEAADRLAFAQAIQAQPLWTHMQSAASAFALDENILLHAGPAFASIGNIPQPIMNSACVAAVYEGIAANFDQAEAMIRAVEIELKPAQDYAVVTPLAAVVSASMPLHCVEDATDPGIRSYAPINGGSRPSLRLGLRSDDVLEHIRWLNGAFCDLLQSGLDQAIELMPIAASGLRHGDDCHGRTPHATGVLMAELERGIRAGIQDANSKQFIESSPSLFLNLWMAATKCIMRRASGIEASSFITAAAGNGVETGIQISAFPGRWFTTDATPPRGRFDIEVPLSRAQGAIGDSAVIEALGLGAMAIHLSPQQQTGLGAFLPENYRERIENLTLGAHPGFSGLDCKIGLSARAAVDLGYGPMIGLGIVDAQGELGRLGGGVYDMPVTPFADAMMALQSKT